MEMQVLACNCPHRVGVQRHIGRRELCFDSISSVCSRTKEQADFTDDVYSQSLSLSRTDQDNSSSTLRVIHIDIPFTTRRTLFTSLLISSFCHPARYTAHALESLTVEKVTPPVVPSGSLFPSEERLVQLFERNTYSVVNIFDVTLRPQLNVTGMVEIPEGNGSGVVWDEQGHIVTNYHVIGNALLRNPSPGQVVARVNILTTEGVQKTFEGKLVGADRTKDLAIIKVHFLTELSSLSLIDILVKQRFCPSVHGYIYNTR